ncbi:MAG TPA: hypothetical protein VNA15_10420 [Candidatus Angelobacter sp.]|nr:hypothetical protein [Candidatus Angelobacter sp.]
MSSEESSLTEFIDSPLTGRKLARLKTRALRKRVWFRALDRVERGLLDLTIRWVDNVRSGRLTEMLLRILVKLARAMEQGMARVIVVGRELALRASVLAVRWGNVEAYSWRSDHGFWLGIAKDLWRND